MAILNSKEKLMMEQKSLNAIIIFSVTLVLLSVIAAICIYYINERKLMASNIENAIVKGIDPLSVRCSYARGDDIICITHAAFAGKKSF
jgi:hypothetical protein|tara:strand:+ start:154 stop:420 length:267 start_codon:yes stop_codon:yes gene_type:complete